MKALDPNRKPINYPVKDFLRDLYFYIWPHKRLFILGSLARLISDLGWLYWAVGFGSVITFLSHYSNGQSLRPLYAILFLLALVSLNRGILHNQAKRLIYRLGVRTSVDLRLAVLRHTLFTDISWHEKENTGNKIQRMGTAGDAISSILALWVNNIMEIVVNLSAMPIILLKFDKTVGLTCLIFLMLYLLLALSFTRKLALAQHEVNVASEVASGMAFETLNNVRTVKVMSAINSLLSKVSLKYEFLYQAIKLRINFARFQSAVLYTYFLAFRIGLIGFVALGVISGHYEVGFLVVVTTYLGQMYESTDELATSYQELATAKYGMARVYELMKEPIRAANEKGKVKLPGAWSKIKIEHLSFKYAENEVLNDISFEIKRGEKIGIVGLSGAGKSTLFKLLLKEYEDYKGLIKFDDLNLHEVSPKDYYAHTAVVLQETEVFNFSLKDNVIIGRENYSKSAFDKALEISHVKDFLHKLPQSVDTLIGEKGVKLSGGEKQRLGIARAVYKEPELLLLDEATSHLDIESEKSIQDSLHKFFESVTAVVIAHRLTTIKEMDRIIVIEGGKLVEEGSFSKLMHTPGGRFRELWRKQKI